MLYKGVTFVNEEVTNISAGSNTVETNQGTQIKYDYLVVCPGVKLRYDLIEGSKEALDDPTSPVGSIYRLDYAYKASQLRENFRGGKAVFCLPTMPIKCGGAPQKMMYLSEETFRRNGVRQHTDIQWYSSAGNMFPNCAKYADALAQIKD